MASRILIVEDEILLARQLAQSLRNLGYEIVGRISSAEEIVRIVAESRPDLILMDINLEGEIDGIEAADQVRTRFDVPVVYLTGYTEKDVLGRAKKTEPYGYLGKPVDILELKNTLETALYKHKADKRVRESEAKYRTLVEQIPAVTYIAALDEASTALYVSPQIESLLGYSPEEYMASPDAWKKSLHPDDRERVLAEMAQSIHSGAPLFSEYRMLAKDGRTVWGSDRAKLVHDANGRPLCFQGVLYDITERKRAEEDLFEREAQFRAIFENAPVMIDGFSSEGDLLLWNNELEKRLGWTREDALSRDVLALCYPDPEVCDEVREAIERADGTFREYTPKAKDGSFRTQLWADFRLPKGNTISVGIDITERKEAEEALRESEARYRQIFEGNTAVKLLIDPESGDIVDANAGASAFYGYTVDEMKHLKITDINALPRDQVFRAMALAKSGLEQRFLFPHRLSSGEIRDVEVFSGPITSQEETLLYSIVHDITDCKKTEEALRESEEKYRLLSENSLTGIYTHQNRVFTYVNQRLADIMGYSVEEIVGQEFWDFVHPDDREAIKERGIAISEGHQLEPTTEFRVVCKNGEVKWLKVFSHPMTSSGGTVNMGNVVDITDRKMAQEDLQEKETLLEHILDASPVGIKYVRNRNISWANRAWENMFGFAHPDEYVGKSTRILYPSDEEYERTGQVFCRTIKHDVTIDTDATLRRTDGSIFQGNLRVRLMDDSDPDKLEVIVAVTDISDRKEAEELVKASLREKEVLLQEIHHRVKNNLAIIDSLLALQSEYATDEVNRNMFEQSQARIRAMCLAHELLYQSGNLTDIQGSKYVNNLLDHLVFSIANVEASILLKREIEDTSFGIKTSIPLGLILTELVSNCFKHAFPDAREGEIMISLQSIGEDEFELVVKDNGIGMPEDVRPDNPKSLGLDLVGMFVDQLNGKIEITGTTGTEVRINFQRREEPTVKPEGV